MLLSSTPYPQLHLENNVSMMRYWRRDVAIGQKTIDVALLLVKTTSHFFLIRKPKGKLPHPRTHLTFIHSAINSIWKGNEILKSRVQSKLTLSLFIGHMHKTIFKDHISYLKEVDTFLYLQSFSQRGTTLVTSFLPPCTLMHYLNQVHI